MVFKPFTSLDLVRGPKIMVLEDRKDGIFSQSCPIVLASAIYLHKRVSKGSLHLF